MSAVPITGEGIMNIEQRLGTADVCYDWYGYMLETFVDEASLQGISIGSDKHGPDIQFSGFYSQGDGLAFAAHTHWPVFIEAHPTFQTELPEWYLVLSADPSVASVSTSVTRGNNLQMNSRVDDLYPICGGFFDGMLINDVPVNDGELERYVKSVCEAEASRMYKELEAEYEYQIEQRIEQVKEEIIEENIDDVRSVLASLLFQGETFQPRLLIIDSDITPYGLDLLGLTERVNGRMWRVTDKGKEVLSGEQRELRADSSSGANDVRG